jgi:hypothetical protein
VSSPLSPEERLAREAVSRIREWFAKRKKREEEGFSPRIAVKFCGGCNPSMERGSVAERIRKKLAGEVTWVSGDEEKDFLLIINGCATACADRPEKRGKIPVVVICGETISP